MEEGRRVVRPEAMTAYEDFTQSDPGCCEPIAPDPAAIVEYAPEPAPAAEYTPEPAPVVEYAPEPAPAAEYAPEPAPAAADFTPAPVEASLAPQAAPGPVNLIDAINAQNSGSGQGQRLVLSSAPMAAPEPAGLGEVMNASTASTGVSLNGAGGLVIGPDPSPRVPLVTHNVDPLNDALSRNAVRNGAGFVATATPFAGMTPMSRSNVSHRYFGNGFWYGA